jgi:hypothetical protein
MFKSYKFRLMPNRQQTKPLNRDVNAALNILWWGLIATPNTAGAAEINACGVSKPLVDDSQMTQIDRDTMKQEACGSLVHR